MRKRVVFFGTPEIAVPSLEALSKDYDVVAVVTKPDTPVGRKKKLTPPAVKVAALALGIPVLQPKSLKPEKKSGSAAIAQLTELAPDVCVVFAYGKILPPDVLDIAPYGCVNIHPSLLPVLRGPSPLQGAILAGLPETGVSIMLLDEEMDTGPILLQEPFTLDPRETAETLHDKAAVLSAQVITRALDGYLAGELMPQPQDSSQATYCRLIKKKDGEIDWSHSAEDIDRQIRAFTPWPGAFTVVDGLRIKIVKAHVEGGQLILEMVQPEGKKPMSYEDFQRGYPEIDLAK
jgi:methionyl-tRNA formyltransferase